jgi:outer membrane lipoprotein LolB
LLRLIFLAAAAMAAAGCSQLGSPATDEQALRLWAGRQQAMIAMDSWDIHARAALRLEEESYNIGLSWERDAERFMLLLEAPFGRGVFRIDGTAGGPYRLRLPDGQVFTNATPDALLEDVIGWQPNSDFSRRIDRGGRARSIRQDSWVIVYLDYFSEQLDPQLPRRIKLSRDELTLKIVIERWQQSEAEQDPSDLFPEFN